MDNQSKKLDTLKKKQDQLKAQIQLLEAAEKTRERKRDTRRKILIGAYYLDKAMEENRLDDIVKFMEGYLNRDSDRALFDLPPLDKKSSGKGSSKQ
jgi:large subunit ribosomal protein L7/L12